MVPLYLVQSTISEVWEKGYIFSLPPPPPGGKNGGKGTKGLKRKNILIFFLVKYRPLCLPKKSEKNREGFVLVAIIIYTPF